MIHFNPQLFVIEAIVLFFGVGIHEFAHCKFADLAGDPTPSYYGRVTLNLFKHFETTGVIFMVLTSLTGFGIGWGNPAPMNPAKMRNPRWDFFIAVIAGPISNLLQALLYGAIFRVTYGGSSFDPYYFVPLLLTFGVAINVALALFNLIPFGPLDGQWLLGLLMPEPMRIRFFQFNRRIGFVGLFAVIIFLQVSNVSLIDGPVMYITNHILGQNFI